MDEAVKKVLTKNKATGYRLSPKLRKANGTDSKDQFIEPTANKDTWYQDNCTDMEFFQKLAGYAQAKSNTAPFLTFFNIKGEFFFQSLQEFFNTDLNNIQTYDLEASYGADNYLHQYALQFVGTRMTYPYYNTTMYSLGNDGSYVANNTTLDKQVLNSKDRAKEGGRTGKNIYPVRSKDVTPLRSVNFFGVGESQDSPAIAGKLNTQYMDVHGAFRMSLSMPFNPELCSGRTLNLKVKSNFGNDKVFATEYSGKWMIIESNHVFNPLLKDEGTNIPLTTLELIKPSVNLWLGNKLASSYIPA
jgi:hypothetical protein